jgi:carotenoid cleavage dioxygenase
MGKPYRYAYTMALPLDRDPAFMGDSRLFKHDLEAGTRETHDFGEGKMPGEFVFVPASATSAEDEGWLVGFVIDAEKKTTDFVILDARNFTGAPQATITIPVQIPPGFHGNFIAL